MKIAIIFLRVIIALMIVLSLMETFYEYDVIKRRFDFDKQTFVDGSGYYDNKTKEDIITEKQSWNKSQLFLWKYLFIWNTSIVFLVLLLLFLQWKVKSITTKEK